MWTKVFVAVCILWACVGVATGQRTQRFWKSQVEEVHEMAGPHTWVSTTGDWGATASWDTNLVPDTGDDVVFDGVASNSDVTAGLTTGKTIGELWVKDSYSGDLGTHATNPLSVATAQLIYQGEGSLFLTGNQFEVLIDSVNLIDAVTITGGTCGNLYFSSGALLSGASAGQVGNAFLYGNDVFWTLESGGGTMGNVHLKAGTIVSHVAQTSARILYVSGGEFTQEGNVLVTSVNIYGGRLTWNCGTGMSSLIAMGGTVDFTQDGRTKTVAVAVVAEGVALLRSSKITFTQLVDLRDAVPILP